MPALPDAPKVIRHTLRFTYQENVDVVNRFFQQYTGSGPIADVDMLAWATAVSNAWGAHMVAAVAIPMVLNSVTSTELTSNTGSEQEYVHDVPGTSTGTPLPANVAMVIREHIERRYRGGHPRQYLCGLTANEQHDAQTWDASSAAAIHTDYVNFRSACALGAPMASQPVVDVNVSYYSGFINHTYPSGRVRPVPVLRGAPVIDVIAAFSVNPKIASQRRRTLQSA